MRVLTALIGLVSGGIQAEVDRKFSIFLWVIKFICRVRVRCRKM